MMFTEGCDKSSPGQNVPGLDNITAWKKNTNDLISATKFPRNLLLLLQKTQAPKDVKHIVE